MPVPKPNKLIVYCSLWAGPTADRLYATVKGRYVVFKRLEEARVLAAANGFTGITVKFS